MLELLGISIVLALAYAIYASTRVDYGHSHTEVSEAHKLHLSGNAKHSAGDIEGALEDYSAGLKIAPRYVPLLLTRSNLYSELEDFDAALADCSLALKIDPKHRDARFRRAKAYEKIGKLGEAITDYDFLLKQYDDASVYGNRCDLFLRLKQYDKALQDANAVQERMPDQWLGHYYLGRIHYAQKHYEKAVAELSLVLADKTLTDALRHFVLSLRCWAHYYTGNFPSGRADAEKMLALLPDNYNSHYSLASGFGMPGQHEEALTHFKRAYEIEPKDVHVVFYLAKTHDKLQQSEDALRFFSEYIQIVPDDASGYLNRAWLYSRLNQVDNAIRDYSTIIENDKTYVARAYNGRSWAKAAAGQYDGMLEDAEQALTLEPDTAIYLSTRGQAYWLINNYDYALTDFEYAHKLEPEHLAYLAEASVAQFALNHHEEAAQLWRELQEKSTEGVTAEALQNDYRWAQPFYAAMQQVEALAKGE